MSVLITIALFVLLALHITLAVFSEAPKARLAYTISACLVGVILLIRFIFGG